MAELAPESCRGVERALPFLTADEGIGSRVVLETTDSAITGCAPKPPAGGHMLETQDLGGVCSTASQPTWSISQCGDAKHMNSFVPRHETTCSCRQGHAVGRLHGKHLW